MSKISFSKEPSGYSTREVDTYIDMIESEHIKAVDLISAQTAKLAELENKISEITIENSRLKEDSKRFDLEISKAYEERDNLKNALEEAQKKQNSPQIFESKDALVEAVLSLARANEKLVEKGGKSRQEKTVYHSPAQVDDIVDNILNEGDRADSSFVPKFSL